MIDNSINARKKITTDENPCIVKIEVYKEYISICDNSGGINNNITADEIFKIEYTDKNGKSGIGMKKSLFTLGDIIDIVSNKKDGSRKFFIDMTQRSDELLYNIEDINYDERKEEGTFIKVKSLREYIKEQVSGLSYIKCDIGRIYNKFIEKGNLNIYINGDKVNPVGIDGDKIDSCEISNNCKMNLYIGNKENSSGVEIFLNDNMIYDREEGKKAIGLTKLKSPKHSFRRCIVEVNYIGSDSNFERDKNKLFKAIKDFINKNEGHFRSRNITVQFDADINRVEELKEFYNEDSAKAVGIKAFDKMYEEYKNSK